MRIFLPMLLVLAHPLAFAATAKPACQEQATTYDSREVFCIIPAAADSRRFEFVARFSGGHDDTVASIQTSVGDRPLVCDEGSKMTLQGEDGDVSLHCRFTVGRGEPGHDSEIKVTIRWSHAQYTSFELLRS